MSKHLLPGEQRNNWNRQPSETLPNKRQITACDLAWGYMHSQSHFFLWALFHDPGMVPLSPYHRRTSIFHRWLLPPEDCGSSSSKAASKLRPMGVGTICLAGWPGDPGEMGVLMAKSSWKLVIIQCHVWVPQGTTLPSWVSCLYIWFIFCQCQGLW